MFRRTFVPLALAAALAQAGGAGAKVLLTADEALALAFPGCAIERRTVFLTPEQVQRAEALAGVALRTARIHPYVASRDGAACGTAYLDTHRVRTLAETLMIAVDPGSAILRIEVLAFDEPLDYLPRPLWYERFAGRDLDPELALRRGVDAVTGATLTAQATTDAARRTLALHRVLAVAEAAAPGIPKPAPAGGTPPQ
jgi:hypothetical protein